MKIVLPIYWIQEFKTKNNKNWLVGMNNYRNWHHRVSHQFKLDFEELVYNQIPEDANKINLFETHYKVYYRRKCDASNIVPLIEKVTLDALNKKDIIEDDNVEFHLASSWVVAGQDKDNPRCEVTIIEI